MMGRLLIWTHFLLLIVLLAPVQKAAACSCAQAHPQTKFCESDFVVVVRVKKVVPVSDYEIAYKVKINRVFKSNPKADIALMQNLLRTPSADSMCGVTLNVGDTYVVNGRIVSGKALISVCGLSIRWADTTTRQRKGLRQLYQQGCVCDVAGQLLDTEFQPTVTATCKGGYMTIRVNLNQSFVGAVHARDHRTPQCMVSGNGTTHATLGINLFASQDSPEYCGVLVNNHTEERSIPIAVRIHKTLELADDKFYVITCGKAGFKNAKNETSLVSLRLLDEGVRVQEAIYGHNYTLRAEISRPDGMYGIRVKNCFAFNKLNSSVQLIDDKGCPVKVRMTKFIYDRSVGIADATLFSMFRFADSSEVHFQCDIAVCRGSCGIPICEGDKEELIKGGSSTNGQSVSSEEGVLLAGTSVFVLQPGEKRAVVQTLYDDGSVHPLWLLWLAVALGILFLIMLIINIFLCSAMTCSCTRTDIIEKEPSIIEDYDPYRSWHGSQYGSRYSLNGKQGYASGGSTMNSTRSISTNSDHYAIVHSRPGSRYSGPGQKHHHHHHRGPPSNIGSHYSGK